MESVIYGFDKDLRAPQGQRVQRAGHGTAGQERHVASMLLSDEQITKFKELFRARFGKDITAEEAREMGANLVQLVQLVYKPIQNPNQKNNKT